MGGEAKSVPGRNGRNPACAGRNPAGWQGEIDSDESVGLSRQSFSGGGWRTCHAKASAAVGWEDFSLWVGKRNPFLGGTDEIRRAPDEILPGGRVKSVLRTGEIDSDESVEWGDAVLGQMGDIFRANCFCPKIALILP